MGSNHTQAQVEEENKWDSWKKKKYKTFLKSNLELVQMAQPGSFWFDNTKYVAASVTRLGDFWKFLAASLLMKVAKHIVDFWGYF